MNHREASKQMDFDHALSYLETVKRRFANDRSKYKSFLEILRSYKFGQNRVPEVLEQVELLFRGHPDLMKKFTAYLPDRFHGKAKESFCRAAAGVESYCSAPKINDLNDKGEASLYYSPVVQANGLHSRVKEMDENTRLNNSSDLKNGVFFEKTPWDERHAHATADIQNELEEQKKTRDRHSNEEFYVKLMHPDPFLAESVAYFERNDVPFEHVELWVPVQVPEISSQRLRYAGSATMHKVVDEVSLTKTTLSEEDRFRLQSFAEYSQKLSVEVEIDSGLPGSVYQTGLSTWQQNVQNTPCNRFKRVGGVSQFGIRTLLALPVPSPNVGRIVVIMYSQRDRPEDRDLVERFCEDLPRLLPVAKWKLVVDVGESHPN